MKMASKSSAKPKGSRRRKPAVAAEDTDDSWKMSAFTCISCRVAFADPELQRGHYKTDWHRYNLKRKVAELPPVTAENFQQRVLTQRAQVAEQDKDTSGHCTVCQKHFSTQNALDNHLKSKKHQDAEAKNARALESEVQKRNEKNQEKGLEVLPENAKVTEKNAKNLELKKLAESGSSGVSAAAAGQSSASTSGQRSSGASGQSSTSKVVDDEDMDSDGESCESWEGEALGLEECLFCSRVSGSMDKNITHMTTAHSFFIPDVEYLVDLEGLMTYLGQKVGEGNICLWCNEKGRSFLSSKSVQQHMVDKGHCKMLHEADALYEYADFYDYRTSYPDHKQGAGEGAEPMEEGEEEVEEEVLREQNYQLVLPSGASVGHRSMQRYYRQKLREERPHNPAAVTKLMAQYKALGWTGTTGPATKKRAKDVAFVQRIRAKARVHIGMKANNQKHFREQVIF